MWVTGDLDLEFEQAEKNAYWEGYNDGFMSAHTKKGRWIPTGNKNMFGESECKCSCCEDSYHTSHWENEHFCRNCGAKMDEEAKE